MRRGGISSSKMSLNRTLRPESTESRQEWINRLLGKGYHPIDVLPRDVLLRIPWEQGPTLQMRATGLPKIDHRDSVAEQNVTLRVSKPEPMGTCTWGFVVYLVMWDVGRARGLNSYNMGTFAADIARYKKDQQLQRALLVTFLMSGIKAHRDRETMRLAIDGALRLLDQNRRISP